MADVSEVNLTCIYCIYFSISKGKFVLCSSQMNLVGFWGGALSMKITI